MTVRWTAMMERSMEERTARKLKPPVLLAYGMAGNGFIPLKKICSSDLSREKYAARGFSRRRYRQN
jgi:hypothetical protein